MKTEDKAVRLIKTIVERVEPAFAVALWTGERLGPPDGPVLKFNDPALVSRILRRPTLDTLLQLWISKALDIEGGSPFDFIKQADESKLKVKLRAIPKRQLLRDVPALLLWRGRSPDAEGLAGSNPFVSGSNKEAITHHYDISNAFYRLFLDDRMVYSCGYFTDFDNGIDQAQMDKLDHICRKLRLKPGERLLDIGCGWGALLIHAVKNYGVIGHGVSLSEAQSALARERIREAGLEDRITIEVKSYLELKGSFDKIASIGMFEHLGLANHAAYFKAVRRLLKPGGIYLHHAITRRMKKNRRDWRKKSPSYKLLIKYIFPGGEVDHIGMSLENMEAYGFEVHDVENLREHYARTCRLWADRLYARFEEAVAEVGEARARLWLVYLTGCSLGFDHASIMIFQTVATRRAPGRSVLPPTRADLYH